ncbi:MAG: ester cyclase [Actinomycetota bacterium]
MSEQNKVVVKRFLEEVVNQKSLETIDELLADDFVEHEEFPGLSTDRAGVKAFFRMHLDAFPDVTFTPEAMVAEGDEVWVHVRAKGTHTGEFVGIPPTNKSIDVQVFDRLRFRRGKCVEHWGVMDQMALMQQLGVVPEGPPA